MLWTQAERTKAAIPCDDLQMLKALFVDLKGGVR
jgi:hypothetical protein